MFSDNLNGSKYGVKSLNLRLKIMTEMFYDEKIYIFENVFRNLIEIPNRKCCMFRDKFSMCWKCVYFLRNFTPRLAKDDFMWRKAMLGYSTQFCSINYDYILDDD